MKCPKCKRNFDRLLALSRRDNKTMICDECGMQEALDDYAKWIERKTDEKEEKE